MQARSRRIVAAGVALACLIAAPAARARPGAVPGAPPDYDFQWATIGAPGNRPTNPDEVPNNDFLRVGAVGYTYRLAKTEVSGADWIEFVRAYAPYVGEAYNSQYFRGGAIFFTGFNQQGVPTYTMNSAFNTQPTLMGWRFAARFCNWLHNDKALTREAFETGAYDTSTFGALPDGTLTDQATRSPGARFWIPSRDEWIKAAYYDPAKNNGEGGYWQQMGMSDLPLVSGLPGEPGAQTGSGVSMPPYPFGIALYPELGPWGLHDMSGGVHEWTETLDALARERFSKGSQAGQGSDYWEADRIDWIGSTRPDSLFGGFRVASLVPGAGTTCTFFTVLLIGNLRRRAG